MKKAQNDILILKMHTCTLHYVILESFNYLNASELQYVKNPSIYSQSKMQFTFLFKHSLDNYKCVRLTLKETFCRKIGKRCSDLQSSYCIYWERQNGLIGWNSFLIQKCLCWKCVKFRQVLFVVKAYICNVSVYV